MPLQRIFSGPTIWYPHRDNFPVEPHIYVSNNIHSKASIGVTSRPIHNLPFLIGPGDHLFPACQGWGNKEANAL